MRLFLCEGNKTIDLLCPVIRKRKPVEADGELAVFKEIVLGGRKS